MKWIIVLLLNVFFVCADAQTAFDKASFIEPYELSITVTKTTNLVFPASITSIDRGSASMLVQKAKGVENILQVKADSKDFTETNLTVITSDGKLYSFLVNYSDSPAYLNINLGMHNAAPENVLEKYCVTATHSKNNLHTLEDENGKVNMDINSFYIADNSLLCKLHLENRSQISYDIEQLRFYIRDKKQGKRTASQETELHPLYVHGDITSVKGKSAEQLVIALPKFTIPDGKYLYVEVLEKNGGRHLSIRVKNRKLIKAKTIVEENS